MRKLILLGLVVLLAAGCGRNPEPGSAGAPPVAPALVIERFLQAVNAQDLETMARLFGTEEGSILNRDPRPEVEKRMYTLALILRHQDYRLEGERPVPGRLGQAIQLVVGMRFPNRQVSVPYTLVRTKTGHWLIEQIDVERITGR
ncbi:MAG TPA: hypothetical protein VKZ58_10275 [Longimicrobiales bacterium]|nr:hypothetical protein [Longimicrobiales bacterium]